MGSTRKGELERVSLVAESEEGVDDCLVVGEVRIPQGVAVIITVQDTVDDDLTNFIRVHQWRSLSF